MIRALKSEPALAHRFLCDMLVRDIRIEKDLIDQLSQSSEKRLARALLLLAREGKSQQVKRICRDIARDLATMLGTTRSRVNAFMNKFRKFGLIGYHGRLDRNGGIRINTSRLRKAFCK